MASRAAIEPTPRAPTPTRDAQRQRELRLQQILDELGWLAKTKIAATNQRG
jgi:hypothetical protein